VLPWRGGRLRWPDDGETLAEVTRKALERLRPALVPEAGSLVWGGDWNHSMRGPERVGSLAGRRAIIELVGDLGLDVATSRCPHRIEGLCSIDHVALPATWRVAAVRRRSAAVGGRALSDHDAYLVEAIPD
jgi:hypothetical protein